MAKKTGRDFIKMMRPVLGLESVRGIREIRIIAAHDDVTLLEVDMIPDIDLDRIAVEEDASGVSIRTKKYTVTVTEAID